MLNRPNPFMDSCHILELCPFIKPKTACLFQPYFDSGSAFYICTKMSNSICLKFQDALVIFLDYLLNTYQFVKIPTKMHCQKCNTGSNI